MKWKGMDVVVVETVWGDRVKEFLDKMCYVWCRNLICFFLFSFTRVAKES